LFAIAVFSNLQRHLSVVENDRSQRDHHLFSTAVGYGSFLITSGILLYIHVPRIWSFLSSGKILTGNVALWDFLANKYGVAYNTSRWLLPLIAGLLCGLLILLIGFGIWSLFRHKRLFQFFSPGTSIAAVFLLPECCFLHRLPWEVDSPNGIAT